MCDINRIRRFSMIFRRIFKYGGDNSKKFSIQFCLSFNSTSTSFCSVLYSRRFFVCSMIGAITSNVCTRNRINLTRFIYISALNSFEFRYGQSVFRRILKDFQCEIEGDSHFIPPKSIPSVHKLAVTYYFVSIFISSLFFKCVFASQKCCVSSSVFPH